LPVEIENGVIDSEYVFEDEARTPTIKLITAYYFDWLAPSRRYETVVYFSI
jgi:hypothetical protein